MALPTGGKLLALASQYPTDTALAKHLGVARSTVTRHIEREGLTDEVRASRSGTPNDRLSPILIVPDVHAPYHDEDAWQLMLDVARDLKPETIVCIGDMADFYAVSSYGKDPERVATLHEEVGVVKEMRAELDALGATTKVFCEGNHEFRLGRYLREKAPELFGMIDVPSVLGLDEAGWDFIPYRDHTKRGAVHYTHDVGTAGRYAAHRALDAYQHSVVTGHVHRLAFIVEGNAVGEAKVSAQFGWLGDVDQIDYMHRARAKKDWALGFGVGYEDRQTGHTFFTPIPIVERRCVFHGKLYHAKHVREAV